MKILDSKRARRLALPLLLAGGLGVGAAVAATITLGSSTLGAGAAAVSACDSTMTASWDDPEWSNGAFSVTGLSVTGIDAAACAGKSYQVVALDGTGAKIDLDPVAPGQNDLTGTYTSGALSAAGLAVPVADAGDIAVTFYG